MISRPATVFNFMTEAARLILLLPVNSQIFYRSAGHAPVWMTLAQMFVCALCEAIIARNHAWLDMWGVATFLTGFAVFTALVILSRTEKNRFNVGAIYALTVAISIWFELGWLLILTLVPNFVEVISDLAKPTPLVIAAIVAACILIFWNAFCLFRVAKLVSSAYFGRLGIAFVTSIIAAALLLPSRPMIYGTHSGQGSEGYIQEAANYILSELRSHGAQDEDSEQKYPNVEATYYNQQTLMTRALSSLRGTDPLRANIYAVMMAPYASQDVFLREASQAQKIVDDRLATRGRSVLLVNHATTVDKHPLASVSNLKSALKHIGKLMDAKSDVLMLFVTSHGSSKFISVYFPSFSLNGLSASELRKALDEANIVNRIIILSACYSGSFIPELKDPNTLILTAASEDKTSFGCSNDRHWTYFGDAFFNHALQETRSVPEAFELAKKKIAMWESDRGLSQSEPQMFMGEQFAQKYHSVLQSLAQDSTAHQEKNIPVPVE